MSKGYRWGVAWIALNDEPLETDVDTVAGFVSVLLLADLWDKNPHKVAKDVVKYRRENNV